MTAPILDHIRSVAHDAGVATGAVVTDLSDGAIDAFHTLDTDRVVDVTAPFVEGAMGVVSTMRRRLNLRNVLIALGVVAVAGIITAAIVRSRRRRDRKESDLASTRVMPRGPQSGDGQPTQPDDRAPTTHQPESAMAAGG